MDCGDHPVLRVNQVADNDLSGCSLMGLGEKILSRVRILYVGS